MLGNLTARAEATAAAAGGQVPGVVVAHLTVEELRQRIAMLEDRLGRADRGRNEE